MAFDRCAIKDYLLTYLMVPEICVLTDGQTDTFIAILRTTTGDE